jgi:hypothetical protein
VDEQILIAATTPRWARVYAAPERQSAGYKGALACSYQAISPAEAVVTLGFGRILTELEVATRRAGQTMVDQMYNQQERRARLAGVEQLLLHVTPEPRRSWAAHITLKLLDSSLALDRLLLGGVIWAMLLLLLSFLVGLNLTAFLVLLGVGVAEIQLFFTALQIARSDRSKP